MYRPFLTSSSTHRLHALEYTMPISAQKDDGAVMYVRIPAFSEFPIISVVHPAYHALPNGGQPSFCPSGNRRLSWERVFATDHSPSEE